MGTRHRLTGLLIAAAWGSGCGERKAPSDLPALAQPTALTVVDSTHHLDALAREPMVVEHADGTLFVSGYGLPGPKLWLSRDGGTSWSRVDVGTEADGAVGNSDVDLAVGPDGTVYFLTMGFNRTTLEGTHVAIGVSHDVGASWTWTRLSTDRFDDRPWIAVAPDGTAHVIWNDGAGVSHAVSADAGITWTERARIHGLGGSSHLAVGPAGEVAVRIVPMSASGNRIDREVDLIAVSTDGGQTWAKHPPPGTREWGFPLGNPADLPRWVEPIAWDGEGSLFYLWSEGNELWLGRSADLGTTWTTWPVVTGTRRLFFPFLIGGGSGALVATWFSSDGTDLQGHATRLVVAGEGPPTQLSPAVVIPEAFLPTESADDPPIRDAAGEYLAATFLRDGEVGLVSPIQNPRADRLGFTWWRLTAR